MHKKGECTQAGSYISTPLTRWTEEARVLDFESIHHHLTSLKPSILKKLQGQLQASLKIMKNQLIKPKYNSKDVGTKVHYVFKLHLI